MAIVYILLFPNPPMYVQLAHFWNSVCENLETTPLPFVVCFWPHLLVWVNVKKKYLSDVWQMLVWYGWHGAHGYGNYHTGCTLTVVTCYLPWWHQNQSCAPSCAQFWPKQRVMAGHDSAAQPWKCWGAIFLPLLEKCWFKKMELEKMKSIV